VQLLKYTPRLIDTTHGTASVVKPSCGSGEIGGSGLFVSSELHSELPPEFHGLDSVSGLKTKSVAIIPKYSNVGAIMQVFERERNIYYNKNLTNSPAGG
jgi:hypothetical protein